MAYTDPTAADIKTRFPAYASVSDPTIEAFIVEAKRLVDDTWLEADYAPAIMYVVAHYLATEDVLGGGAGATSPGPVKSESLGDASTTYDTRGGSTTMSVEDSEFANTVYGTRFLNIRRRNFAGPLVVL